MCIAYIHTTYLYSIYLLGTGHLHTYVHTYICETKVELKVLLFKAPIVRIFHIVLKYLNLNIKIILHILIRYLTNIGIFCY